MEIVLTENHHPHQCCWVNQHALNSFCYLSWLLIFGVPNEEMAGKFLRDNSYFRTSTCKVNWHIPINTLVPIQLAHEAMDYHSSLCLQQKINVTKIELDKNPHQGRSKLFKAVVPQSKQVIFLQLYYFNVELNAIINRLQLCIQQIRDTRDMRFTSDCNLPSASVVFIYGTSNSP